MTAKLGWGLIGASTIAKEHMIGAIRAQGGEAVAVMSSDAERGPSATPPRTASPRSYDSVDALLADPAVEIVYISTTNELHKPQTLAAAAAGKHVLCEKPLALTRGRRPRDGRGLPRRRRGDGHQPPSAQRRHPPGHARRDQGRPDRPPAVRARVPRRLPAAAPAGLADHHARGRRRRHARHHRPRRRHAALRARRRADRGRGDEPVGPAWRPRGSRTATWRSCASAPGCSPRSTRRSRPPFAGTGFEVHGSEGSLIARDVMTQRPVGEVLLRTAAGEEQLPVDAREPLRARHPPVPRRRARRGRAGGDRRGRRVVAGHGARGARCGRARAGVIAVETGLG